MQQLLQLLKHKQVVVLIVIAATTNSYSDQSSGSNLTPTFLLGGMMKFNTPGNISVQTPEGVESVEAHGNYIDITLYGVIVRVTPDSIGVSFLGSTECAMVSAPKQSGLRILGYIQGCREQGLTAVWDEVGHKARLEARDEDSHVVVYFEGDDVDIRVNDLPPNVDMGVDIDIKF